MSTMTRTAWGLDARGEGWRHRAACGPDTAEWFVIGGCGLSAANRRALVLCEACPVLVECRRYEEANPQKFPRVAGGVAWNGRDGTARRQGAVA
jgi:hypothetical protein